VHTRTNTAGENEGWVDTSVARVPLANIHARTVSAAYFSRGTYATLLSNYQSSGYNGTVDGITQQVLSRAVNDLADIIQAIPSGAGIEPIGTLDTVSFREYIGQNRNTGVISTYTDAGGNPIEGMRVITVWYFPTGTVTDIDFTDENGVAESWLNSGPQPLGAEFDVTATTNSGAAQTSDTVTLKVSDTIGTIKVSVPYYPPMQKTLLTASCLILNQYGEPISGLPVTLTWSFKTGDVVYQTTTNKWGMAIDPRNIGNAAIGHKVTVTAETQSGGSDRSSYATFVPKASNGDRTNYTRVWGNDRFSTGAAISKRAYPLGADTIIVATARNWPDALGGSALSGAYDAPIILCDTNSLPAAIKSEVKRLGATRAIILGGTASVGKGVEKDLKAVGIKSISRIGGANRYEAARNVARATIAKAGAGYEGVAFVSSGGAFADALSASPLAAFRRWPIYLADPAGSPTRLASQMRADGVRKVIVLGGTASVSKAYENAFRSKVGETSRLGGRNRYDASATIAKYGAANAGLQYDGVNIASGMVFPDALAGGALANKKRCVMLLTDGKKLSPEPAAVLATNKDDIGTFHFLGGSATVTTNVKNQVIAVLE
jgi:putative cell wall-binding protein